MIALLCFSFHAAIICYFRHFLHYRLLPLLPLVVSRRHYAAHEIFFIFVSRHAFIPRCYFTIISPCHFVISYYYFVLPYFAATRDDECRFSLLCRYLRFCQLSLRLRHKTYCLAMPFHIHVTHPDAMMRCASDAADYMLPRWCAWVMRQPCHYLLYGHATKLFCRLRAIYAIWAFDDILPPVAAAVFFILIVIAMLPPLLIYERLY